MQHPTVLALMLWRVSTRGHMKCAGMLSLGSEAMPYLHKLSGAIALQHVELYRVIWLLLIQPI